MANMERTPVSVRDEIEGLIESRLGGLDYRLDDDADRADVASIIVGTLAEFPDLLVRLAIEAGALRVVNDPHDYLGDWDAAHGWRPLFSVRFGHRLVYEITGGR